MINNKDISKIININCQHYYTIAWQTTKWCNFHCPECISGCTDYNTFYLSQDDLEQRANNLHLIIKNSIYPYCQKKNLKIELVLSGGEVTYYNLIKIIKIVGIEYLSLIRIITNFSKPINYFIELNNFCTMNNLQFILSVSYHKEFGNENDFIQKCITSSQKNIFTKINWYVNQNSFNQKYFDYILYNTNVLAKINKERDPKTNKNLELTQQQEEYLVIFNKEMLNKMLNSPLYPTKIILKDNTEYTYFDGVTAISNIDNGFLSLGYKCYAGVFGCSIYADGRIVKARCQMNRFKQFYLGNINTDTSMDISEEPCICCNQHPCSACYNTIYEKLN
jgi:hypothetical protein